MLAHHFAHQVQPEPSAAVERADAVEGLEDLLAMFRRNARSAVMHLESAVAGDLDLYGSVVAACTTAFCVKFASNRSMAPRSPSTQAEGAGALSEMS